MNRRKKDEYEDYKVPLCFLFFNSGSKSCYPLDTKQWQEDLPLQDWKVEKNLFDVGEEIHRSISLCYIVTHIYDEVDWSILMKELEGFDHIWLIDDEPVSENVIIKKYKEKMICSIVDQLKQEGKLVSILNPIKLA